MKFDTGPLFGHSPRTLAVAYFCVGVVAVSLGDAAVVTQTSSSSVWSPVRLIGVVVFVGLSSLVVYGTALHHQQQAAEARDDLQRSNQQRQVMSRVFRHNIRNDLNVIQGYTGLLSDRLDGDREQAYLDTIHETTDDIIAISEKLRVIEDASSDAPAEQIDLVAAVEEAADHVDDADVSLTVETPCEAWIYADRSLAYPIQEVFENAVIHNDEATCEVTALITQNGESTCLEITDNGPGIPPAERAVLQAEEETPLSHASSIGLWLIKWMCETQGGTVAFETSDDGTTVRLRFESAPAV